MNGITSVTVDLDGVLADFIRGACDAHEVSHLEVIDRWARGSWDDITRLVADGDEDKFWYPIRKQGVSFWRWLPMLPHAAEIVRMASRIDPNWQVATIIDGPESAHGKALWIKNNIGRWFRRYYLCNSTKSGLSAPGRLLIDDSDKNCREWEEAGGKAVLVPQPWNSNWAIHDDGEEMVLDYLMDRVNTLTGGLIYGRT